MSIIDFSFILFVLVLALIYYCLPNNRWIVLLLGSVIFYISYNSKLCIPICLSVVSVFFAGRKLEQLKLKMNDEISNADKNVKRVIKEQYKKRKKAIVAFAAVFNIGLLVYFKFFNLIVMWLEEIFSLDSNSVLRVMLPLGISFYSLQAVGYVVDVYRGEKAENNIFKLTLFLTYFPIMTQGPILKYKNIKEQMFVGGGQIDYIKVKNAMLLMLWGYFKKLVIADRLYPLIEAVFSEYNTYAGSQIIFAALAYAIQLYCDFSGGIDVIMGVSELFGIRLEKNFERPYFSKSLSEFWRRWHISLGAWFREYIFMPLSISKRSNELGKRLRKYMDIKLAKQIPVYLSLWLVWLLNGIWHGAGTKYIVFGIYQGIIIIFETWQKTNINMLKIPAKSEKTFNIIKTFVLICIGWIIIRVPSAGDIIPIFRQIALNMEIRQLNLEFLNSFWNNTDIIVLVESIIVLIGVSLIQRKQSVREWVLKRNIAVRWFVYYYLVMNLLVLTYSSSDLTGGFIYAQF